MFFTYVKTSHEPASTRYTFGLFLIVAYFDRCRNEIEKSVVMTFALTVRKESPFDQNRLPRVTPGF